MTQGRAGDLYGQLKDMAVNFRLKPGEKINEAALAKALKTSRTPLREALHRLAAEQFFEFQPGRGFFCRPLDSQTIFELYETREILEVAAVRLACVRASDDEIANLRRFLKTDGKDYVGKTVGEATRLDETFHLRIAEMAGNGELLRQLSLLYERIRFIRFLDISNRAMRSKSAHKQIMAAIEARDADRAGEAMRSHIVKRIDQIVETVKAGYSNIYVPDQQDLHQTVITKHKEA